MHGRPTAERIPHPVLSDSRPGKRIVRPAETCDWRAGVGDCLENSRRPVHLVGVGNALRRDDGAGVTVVSSLSRAFGAAPPAWVRLHGNGVATERALSRIPSDEGLLVFDAVEARLKPGQIVCARLSDTRYGFFATHNIPLGLIPSLAGRKDSVFVIGIQPKSLEVGEGLTEDVQRSVDALVAEVARQVEARS